MMTKKLGIQKDLVRSQLELLIGMPVLEIPIEDILVSAKRAGASVLYSEDLPLSH